MPRDYFDNPFACQTPVDKSVLKQQKLHICRVEVDLDSFMWKLRFWPATYSVAKSTPHWRSEQGEILDSTAFRYLLMQKAHNGSRPQCSSFTHLSCFSSALGEELLRTGWVKTQLLSCAASKLMLPRKKRFFVFCLGQPETKITVIFKFLLHLLWTY